MSAQKPIFINVLDNEPIADFCSQSYEICFSYDWSLQFIKDGADGNPLVSLEVSNDNVHWDAYNACSTDVYLNQDSIRFIDDILPSPYFRVCIKANGTTTGTVTAILVLTRK